MVHSVCCSIVILSWYGHDFFLHNAEVREAGKKAWWPSNHTTSFAFFLTTSEWITKCTYGKLKVDCASAILTLLYCFLFLIFDCSPDFWLLLGRGLYFLATAKHSIPLGEIYPLLAFSLFTSSPSSSHPFIPQDNINKKSRCNFVFFLHWGRFSFFKI